MCACVCVSVCVCVCVSMSVSMSVCVCVGGVFQLKDTVLKESWVLQQGIVCEGASGRL